MLTKELYAAIDAKVAEYYPNSRRDANECASLRNTLIDVAELAIGRIDFPTAKEMGIDEKTEQAINKMVESTFEAERQDKAAQKAIIDERDHLQRFKDFVHRRLDKAGIPTHPDGEHSKAGCRIGDRLDIALSAMPKWDAFDTAPKDGTWFIAFQDGEIYHASYREDGRLVFRTHSLYSPKTYENIITTLRGKQVKGQVLLNEGAEEFKHQSTFWTRGFEFKPTHWTALLPLPTPPQEQP